MIRINSKTLQTGCLKAHAELRKDWDEKYGDRMIKLVFIGQQLDKEKATSLLDGCLAK